MPSNIYRRPGSKVWWFRAEQGRRERRCSLQTTDLRLARKRAAVELERLSRARWGDERRTWKEAVVRWAEEVAPQQLAGRTRDRYLFSLRLAAPVLGPLYLDEIDRRVIAQLAARPGVTNATRRRDLTAVSAVLRHCVGWGWLEHNPARQYDRSLIRERRDPIVLPTAAEVGRLVARLPPMLAAMVRLLELTGMRLEEAGGLTWRQVDLNRRTISLERTKAGRVRVIALSAQAAGTLAALPRHLACPFVFWHGQESARRYAHLSEHLLKYRRAVGVTWRVHDLRHLFAVRWLQDGGSIYALQQTLGHTSIKTTEIYLAYLTSEEAERAKGAAT